MMPAINEVLPEPGALQIWATFGDGVTHLISLDQVIELPEFRALKLRKLFGRVTVSLDGMRLEWPGGAWIGADDVLLAPEGRLPLRSIARVPRAQRFRPMLPYLRHLDMEIYLRSDPITPSAVTTLLRLKPTELETAMKFLRAPDEQVLGRLCDLGACLIEYFSADDMYRLLRRPWRFGMEQCPGQPLLHTMLGCLMYGRPDLVEWVCTILLTGKTL